MTTSTLERSARIAKSTKTYDTKPVQHDPSHGPPPFSIIRTGDFQHHQGFDSRWNIPGCTSNSVVMVSIAELTVRDGQVVPFQGDASMQVHNVVPEQDAVRVRGLIGWDSDLNTRLSFFVA